MDYNSKMAFELAQQESNYIEKHTQIKYFEHHKGSQATFAGQKSSHKQSIDE